MKHLLADDPQVQQLIQDAQDSSSNTFAFDLNLSGQVRVIAEPNIVLELIMIARSLAPREMYGEHNAILSQFVLRKRLAENSVLWFRLGHVAQGPNEDWVSVEQWLQEQGSPYIPVSE